jgi:hypothetical protein
VENFNDAEQHTEFGLIPNNTIAKARLTIKPGGDFSDSFLTRSKDGNSAYLNCEFVIMEGQFVRRKIFDKIGICSEEEMQEAIDACKSVGNDDITLLKCTSASGRRT